MIEHWPPSPRIDVTPDGSIDPTFPSIDVVFTNGVRMTPAIHYTRPRSFRPLMLDLYRCARSSERTSRGAPVLIFIHGGSWTRGDSRSSRPLKDFPTVLAAIAARGYVVASIDYRFVGEAIWPAQGRDVNAAIRFLRKNAAQFGIDPNRVSTWGVSCGGHLSAIAATTAGILSPEDDTLRDVDDRVQAAVAWYGGFNMSSLAAQCAQGGAFSRTQREAPEWNLLGGQPHELDPAFVRSASPAQLVTAAMPPMLIVTGDSDVLIPHLQSVEMSDSMKQAGADSELLIIPGVGHDLAGADQTATRAGNQQAMDATMRFLDRVLRPETTSA